MRMSEAETKGRRVAAEVDGADDRILLPVLFVVILGPAYIKVMALQ